ncbi:zf-HC2 domain-containing protein [Paenibacillus sp. CC-CFT747]|nr:zf-HC2 domain-containing protein [Paenibacillus sp. CC-CFT747]
MKCADIQEWLGSYFDLPPDDSRREEVDRHIQTCEACAEEYALWAESTELIRSVSAEEVVPMEEPVPVSSRVMSRIYESESWRMPVSSKIYSIPYKTRRNLFMVISLCLALFLGSFVYSLTGSPSEVGDASDSPFGLKHPASASSFSKDDSLNVHYMSKSAVASVSSHIMGPVKLGPIHTYPDYLLAISFLGLISALLILNWLSRTHK